MMMPRQSSTPSLRLALLIRPLLLKGDASASKVAALMSMPARTLQRRLAEQGTSFRRILTEIRLQLIDEFLTRKDVTLTEMAPVLGLSEVSAVSRFLRIHGNQSAKAAKGAKRRPDAKKQALNS